MLRRGWAILLALVQVIDVGDAFSCRSTSMPRAPEAWGYVRSISLVAAKAVAAVAAEEVNILS